MDLSMLPQVNLPEGMIHLGLGQPGNDMLPVRQLERAAQRAMKDENISFLSYGNEKGNIGFRQALAQFLSDQTGAGVDPEDLFITNGNSQALDLICTLYSRPGDTVLVEEPSYFLALRIFADHGLKIVSIPLDDKGMNPDILEQKIAAHSPAFVYCIPTHHNPAGVTLPQNRRHRIADICNDSETLLVADEVYHFLTYTESESYSMGNFCEDAPVLSLGSFSKILAPGLRLGWIQAGEKLINRLIRSGLLISGGGLNPFTSRIIESLIRHNDLAEHIGYLKRIYTKRLTVLCDSLEQHLPPGCSFFRPSGGYFVWVKLMPHINTRQLRVTAKAQDLDFLPGEMFSHNKGLARYIRLAFCLYDTAEIEKGVQRLGRLLQKAPFDRM